MNYVDVLQSDFFKKTYALIEEFKKEFPVNHGFKHVDNVVFYASLLAELFELSENEKTYLLIACVLHDIGYINGKEKHAENGAIIAREFLLQNDFSDNEIKIVCDAIKFHSAKTKEVFASKVSFCLAFADKLDFAKNRYDENSTDPLVLNFLKIDSNKLSRSGKNLLLEIYHEDGFSVDALSEDYFFKKLKTFLCSIAENTGFQTRIDFVLKNEGQKE